MYSGNKIDMVLKINMEQTKQFIDTNRDEEKKFHLIYNVNYSTAMAMTIYQIHTTKGAGEVFRQALAGLGLVSCRLA